MTTSNVARKKRSAHLCVRCERNTYIEKGESFKTSISIFSQLLFSFKGVDWDKERDLTFKNYKSEIYIFLKDFN